MDIGLQYCASSGSCEEKEEQKGVVLNALVVFSRPRVNCLALTYISLILGHKLSTPDYGNEGTDCLQVSYRHL
jgi:hypothetical protein